MRRSTFAWVLVLAVGGPLAWAEDDDGPVLPPDPPTVVFNFAAEPEAPPPPAPEAKPGLIPGGVVDEKWTHAFITDPDDKVEAIDVKTGKTLFKSASPGQVLGVSGDRVYVLTPQIGEDATVVVTLRAMSIKAQGKYVFESKPLPVPGWIKNGYGVSLLANAKFESGKVAVSWIATGRAGAESEMEMRKQIGWGGDHRAPAAAYGTINVDLSSGEGKTSETTDATMAQVIQQMQYSSNTSQKIDENRMLVVQGYQTPGRAKWIEQKVSHSGLEYSLKAAVSGKTKLICRDPQGERTLWEREMVTIPGTLPPIPPAAPVQPDRSGLTIRSVKVSK